MVKRYKQFVNESSDEQNKIDELLDKGIENLTPSEKALLDKLSAGGSLEKKPGKKVLDQNDADIDFLNKMLGTNLDSSTKVYGIGPGEEKSFSLDNNFNFGPDDDVNNDVESDFTEGDRITYNKDGSEYDGKSGIFIGMREDGKYRLVFDDGKKFVASPKNIIKFGDKPKLKPKKKLPEGYKEIPEDKIGRASWGPGAFNVPDNFYGSKNKPDVSFKKGDKITYTKNNKNGTFIEIREDGKYSIRFDDGGRMAVNPKSVIPIVNVEKLPKKDFTIRLGNVPDEEGVIGAGIFLDNGSMYDQEITYEYPELSAMGFDEPADCDLRYYDDRTKEDLADELRDRGFRVEIVKGNLW